jgi:hypothetical protein
VQRGSIWTLLLISISKLFFTTEAATQDGIGFRTASEALDARVLLPGVAPFQKTAGSGYVTHPPTTCWKMALLWRAFNAAVCAAAAAAAAAARRRC